MANTTTLDIDELLHLALYATKQNQHDKAIAYLKKILEQDDSHAQSWYLLGAVHAEIGMYERAIEVDNGNLPETAQFQLGLLYLTSGQLEPAERVWLPLDKLGEKNSLYLFKRGMLHLAEDNFQACIDDLNTGISLNNLNEDLNNDMHRLIQTIKKKTSTDRVSPNNDSESPKGKRILLDAYNKQNYEK